MFKMISREEAIDVISMLEESDILKDDLKEKLTDIRTCIEAELQGWHFWSANDDDYVELHIARRSDLWTDEVKQKCEALDKAHTFIPAPYEKNYINRDPDGEGEEENEAAGDYV